MRTREVISAGGALMLPCKSIHLGPAAFDDVTSCCGPQLVLLLQVIERLQPDLKWYVADVETMGPFPIPLREPTPILLGSTEFLIQAAQRVVQFTSGVFAGVLRSIDQPMFRPGGLWTEDEDLADLGEAFVEVRAFDTTYWSVATADAKFADSILREFGAVG